jgi:hypothetical protein
VRRKQRDYREDEFDDGIFSRCLERVNVGLSVLVLPLIPLVWIVETVGRKVSRKNRAEKAVKSWTGRLQEIRASYAKAYQPWTPKDDAKLEARFRAKVRIRLLAKEFQRRPGAIRSRLRKLGLI